MLNLEFYKDIASKVKRNWKSKKFDFKNLPQKLEVAFFIQPMQFFQVITKFRSAT